MINDDSWYVVMKKKFDELDWESIRKKEEQKFIEEQKRVANKHYCYWIEALLECLDEPYNDESWAYGTQKWKNSYTTTVNDINKEKDLRHFHTFLNIVADIQRVKEYYDDRDGYPEYEYVWKFNDKYFEWNTLVGQGSITTIKQIGKPDFAYIDLDLYFEKEEEGNPQRKYKKNF